MLEPYCLYDYQTDILQRLSEEWHTHRSVMIQMPTGTGKTHVLAAVVKCFLAEQDGAVWIVAHRRELVVQAEEIIGRYGISVTEGKVRVMSVQWLSRHWKESGRQPALVIIDEAHHARAATYRMLWECCPGARFLGLTATPCRMDHQGFTDLFDVLITSWSIAEFIQQGQLSAFDYVSIRATSREQRLIDSLEKRGADGDYQVKEMNALLNRQPSIERLYKSMAAFANNKKGIVYAISIDHARSIAAYYNKKGVRTVAIDSQTPAAERKRMVEEFKAGQISVLVNVDVFSEGFDCPDVEFVQLARPTLSLAKYLQQVGRGLRKTAGKEACVLIDNVGLYRIFGLPTVVWNWDAMFRGEITGKGIRSERARNETGYACLLADNSPSNDCELEVIVSHDRLLSVIEEKMSVSSLAPKKMSALKAWQDKDSGLWGLSRGRKKTTAAIYSAVLDCKNDRAAVRFRDHRSGVVTAVGEVVWEHEECRSMQLLRNAFLAVKELDGSEHYVDLYSRAVYDEMPKIKRYGDIELLRTGTIYYSRTRVRYVNRQHLSNRSIFDRGFYLIILDADVPPVCRQNTGGQRNAAYGYICLLADDYDCYYWIYRWLADGSIVVRDQEGRYYFVERGKEKRYIGCDTSAEVHAELRKKLMQLDGLVAKNQQREQEQQRVRRQRAAGLIDYAVPFQTGMKWGLRVGGRVIVPPVYRNVRPPVGRYCAVEKNYCQWGVIAVDGTILVEPKYSEVEISEQGTVTLTKATGRKEQMKLP